MALQEKIQHVFSSFPAKFSEKNGLHTVKCIVAERNSLLSRKKLVYIAKYRIVEDQQDLRFTEMLKETGFGLSTGGEDFNTSPGFGFKKERYNTTSDERDSVIEEQSNLFGKKYNYTFDFKTIRETIKEIAQEAGFTFKYQITSFGL